MNLRTIAVLAGAVVAAAVVGPPLALRDRLPDPMAVHWGPGMAPPTTPCPSPPT
ncbi:hypothetical protein ACFSTC_36430 [Nonomuraea ferruginea]